MSFILMAEIVHESVTKITEQKTINNKKRYIFYIYNEIIQYFSFSVNIL